MTHAQAARELASMVRLLTGIAARSYLRSAAHYRRAGEPRQARRMLAIAGEQRKRLTGVAR